MISFLKLIRYQNLLMVLLTMILTKYALIHYLFPQAGLTNFDFALLSMSVLFITAGGYIVNDIYDVDVDKINKPKKVIVTTSISKRNAWVLYSIFSLVGLGLGVYLSIDKHLYNYIIFFIATTLGLFVYSVYFQKIPLIGNVLVATLCAFVIYVTKVFDLSMSGEAFDNAFEKLTPIKLSFWLLLYYFFLRISFGITLIREILKDIEDINGDYNGRYQTLPILLGIKRTRNLVIFLSILLFLYTILVAWATIHFDFLVVTYTLFGISFLQLSFIYKIWSANSKKEFSQLSNLLKIIMLLGILSMGLFKFI